MIDLKELGWGPFFEQEWIDDPLYQPARVSEEHKDAYRVVSQQGVMLADVAGHMRHAAAGRADFPAVGDWVRINGRPSEGRATIHGILPRRTRFSRKVAGDGVAEQIVATNIDIVFLVTSLNADLNLRRIERYLATIWESGAQPVVLLNKADLWDDPAPAVGEVASIAAGAPVHAISAVALNGLDPVQPYIAGGVTIALIGSSGVGKSSIINRVLGMNEQDVLETRMHDDRGRHATTYRKLFLLPRGGILIDTPGMRELQLWDTEVGVQQAFEDVEDLSQYCRFRDCTHQTEPGCAVHQAIAGGKLDANRLQSYLKLKKELAHLARKNDAAGQSEQKKHWKKIHKAQKQNDKLKRES